MMVFICFTSLSSFLENCRFHETDKIHCISFLQMCEKLPHIYWLKKHPQMYYLTDFMGQKSSTTRLGSHQVEIKVSSEYVLIWRLNQGHFQTLSDCWPNLFLYDCMTEVPVFCWLQQGTALGSLRLLSSLLRCVSLHWSFHKPSLMLIELECSFFSGQANNL